MNCLEEVTLGTLRRHDIRKQKMESTVVTVLLSDGSAWGRGLGGEEGTISSIALEALGP